MYRHINFKTHFTICLDGSIKIEENGSGTGIGIRCHILRLVSSDFEDIRKALSELKGRYIYNRKLNQLVDNDNIGSKQDI